jgi:hypothetical protein
MNGVPDEKFKLSLKQSSKGFWYVDDISVSAQEYQEAVALMDAFTTQVVKLLEVKNKGVGPQ